MRTSRVLVLRCLAGLAWASTWVAPRAVRADDHRVAVNVSVGRGLKLDGSDLSRVVRGQLGRYGGVVALPEATTKDAIAEERASTNSKCKSGLLDQKCQLALGSALAASHWLEVLVSKPGKSCEVSVEYLSIQRESSDGGDNVPAACDRDAVATALRQGLETIARKQRWSGVGSGPAGSSLGGGSAAAEDRDDPVARALRDAEAAKAKAAAEAEQTAQAAAERVRGAEERWPAVSQLARDRATPPESRLAALRAFVGAYSGTERAREAEALMASLEAERARARADEGRGGASPEPLPAASPTGFGRATERAPKQTPAADAKKSLNDAKRGYTDGFQAFMYGELSRAKMHALSCLKSAEYAPCHSLLGRIYAQEKKVRESVRHYKQYLELAPNAPDASKVREIIANAEKSR
jgi:hypothetical protein